MGQNDRNCDYCDDTFASELEQARHMLTEHEDELTSNEKDQLKKAGRKEHADQQVRRQRDRRRKKQLGYGLAAILGVILLVAVGSQFVTLNVSSPSPSGDSVDASQISLDGEPMLGDENAPVTVVEFADYQCPFCRKFSLQTFDQLKANYIDTGKVRFVYKDFPLEQMHDRAIEMAEAANCAADQGKYWEMNKKLFNEQQEISPGRMARFSADKIPQWAEEIGLNMDEFNQCTSASEYEAEAREDLQEGQKLGVTGTPTFFVYADGDATATKIGGAQPYSKFKQIIDGKMNQQGE